MQQATLFQEQLCAKFESLGSIRCRPYLMVCGLYYQDYFFGIITNDKVYFKTNDITARWYLHRQMPPFSVPMDDKHHFYEVPQKIIDKPNILMRLAREAIAVCRERVPESPMPQGIGGH